jgi:hypothetical protein
MKTVMNLLWMVVLFAIFAVMRAAGFAPGITLLALLGLMAAWALAKWAFRKAAEE